ncbi:MAG TPA: 1-acyl-sn-glycerol-3-phosphate acyltransferase [Anaerolineales bacterium]|nr:1-acyl-sn-glycerol-3-phosphate acyltransferase [Anaerolineales bacterium]
MTASLTDINLDDLVASFGWQEQVFLRGMLRFAFRGAAAKFARQMRRFDRAVGQAGLPEGARQSLGGFVKNVRVFGDGNLPAAGPALYLSNHPGMTDTLCLFAALRRPDLKILALRRPFLQALPNVSRNLLFLDDDPLERMGVVRKGAAHLRSGGPLLTFPAGRIEPDPDVYPGAWEALDGWLDSAGAFLRLAPETKIVPVLVRNVLWRRAVRHPLTRLKSGREERERLGAAFQLLSQILFDVRPVTVKIQVAPPLSLERIGSRAPAAIHAAVLASMRSLVQSSPLGEGRTLL